MLVHSSKMNNLATYSSTNSIYSHPDCSHYIDLANCSFTIAAAVMLHSHLDSFDHISYSHYCCCYNPIVGTVVVHSRIDIIIISLSRYYTVVGFSYTNDCCCHRSIINPVTSNHHHHSHCRVQ